MSRPWMPLYVADYLADTAHLSAAEHGAYLLLIMHYWTKGGLPSEEEGIRRITRLTSHQWKKSRDVLRTFFLDGWRHGRIDEELAKAIEKSSTNSANAKRRQSERTADAERTHTQPQSQPHKEDIIGSARAKLDFSEGAKALADAFWKAQGFASTLEIPPEYAGTDWRAREWERANWTPEMITAEVARVGRGKPTSYYEKVFASAHAKLNAPLPKVEIREAEVVHGTVQRKSGVAAIAGAWADQLEAAAGDGGAPDAGVVLRLPTR